MHYWTMAINPDELQVLVDALPVLSGLTVIEAPTGSVKRKRWPMRKLIDQQIADSVIFALPTQATANAMLTRMEASASHLFSSPKSVMLPTY